jgi:hypothetical protein
MEAMEATSNAARRVNVWFCDVFVISCLSFVENFSRSLSALPRQRPLARGFEISRHRMQIEPAPRLHDLARVRERRPASSRGAPGHGMGGAFDRAG